MGAWTLWDGVPQPRGCAETGRDGQVDGPAVLGKQASERSSNAASGCRTWRWRVLTLKPVRTWPTPRGSHNWTIASVMKRAIPRARIAARARTTLAGNYSPRTCREFKLVRHQTIHNNNANSTNSPESTAAYKVHLSNTT